MIANESRVRRASLMSVRLTFTDIGASGTKEKTEVLIFA